MSLTLFFNEAVSLLEVFLMIAWPCLLKLDGDDELIYLDTADDFTAELQDLILSGGDYVIDSKGRQYFIALIAEQPKLSKTKQVLSADDISHLIAAHEFTKASLCLTKMHFVSVADAIKSLSAEKIK